MIASDQLLALIKNSPFLSTVSMCTFDDMGHKCLLTWPTSRVFINEFIPTYRLFFMKQESIWQVRWPLTEATPIAKNLPTPVSFPANVPDNGNISSNVLSQKSHLQEQRRAKNLCSPHFFNLVLFLMSLTQQIWARSGFLYTSGRDTVPPRV